MIGGPKTPQSCLSRVQTPTINAEGTKVYGWKALGILVVNQDDQRLSWPERELIKQLGEKLYGRQRREVGHG